MTRRRSVIRPVLAAALAAVLASACGGSSEVAAPDPTTVPPGATSPADATSSATPDPGPGGNLAALDFVAPDLSGGQVRGADHAGKDVVLWMWAPW